MLNNHSTNIVVVDDEKYICNIIEEALSPEKYNVVSFWDPGLALEHIQENPVDLVLTDLVMAEYSGVQVLDATLASHGDAVVILMTAHPTVQTAISVLKKGAYDFLVKPFKLDLLKATIRRGLEHQQVLRYNVHLKGQLEFLKVANASVAGVDIENFLKMVVQSCRKELSARAVAVIEVDPKSKEIVRQIHESEREEHLSEVLSESTLLSFSYTKSSKPVVRREQVEHDGKKASRIFISQPIFSSRRFLGVINVLVISRFDELTSGQLDVLTILGNSTASAIANYRLYQDLQTSYLQAIGGLANAIEARDEYTAGHTDRVSHLARHIALELGWDKARIDTLAVGCTLHDIGKIGVPDSILNKPGRLTEEERQRMRRHPEVGLKIIRGIDLLKPATPYIIAHHEWYDGTGYPKRLKGEEIPVEGRLLAVADTFDAILSDRPYRDGASLETAISELIEFRGVQFDPGIVDAFLQVIKKGEVNLREMYGRDEDVGILEEQPLTEKAQV